MWSNPNAILWRAIKWRSVKSGKSYLSAYKNWRHLQAKLTWYYHRNLLMAYVPQNVKAGVGPVISAVFLNGLDVTANIVLNGAQTIPEAHAVLGL
jgi:hypothetical protein